MSRSLLCALMALALLAGCSKPKPPEKDRPPEPQATHLRDAIQAPLDKARAADENARKAADQQRAAIDAAESGNGD
jgi:ABC-type uncharacterized transport system auxiliary subunit